MSELRSALRAYAIEDPSPAGVVAKLARFVMHRSAPMVTLVYGTMDLESGRIRMVRAGHPYPLLIDAQGNPTFLDEGGSTPLSAAGPGRYTESEVVLGRDEALFLYTDGLIERRDRRLSDQERALAVAVERAPDDLEATCTVVIDAMTERGALPDDIAVLIIRNTGLGDRIEFEIGTRTDELVRVRGLLRRWLGEFGASGDDIDSISLAASEACANSIEHAYGPGDARIAVVAARDGDVATVEVRDHGRWRESRGGARGRGIALMREFMDAVDIDASDEGTTVRLTRRLRSGR